MPSKIKRISRIRNFRAFQDWRPDAAFDFHPVCNVIFGLNGSGKSTLSEVLAQSTPASTWDHGLALELLDGGTISNAHQANTLPIHVFNRVFIEDNLHFDAPEGPTTQALLVLGKEAKDKERRLKQAKVDLSQAIEKRDSAKKALQKLERDRDAFLSQIATELVKSLGKFLPKFEGRKYDRGTIRPLFMKAADPDPSPIPDLEALTQKVQQEPKTTITWTPPPPRTLDALMARVIELLGRTALSRPIPDLLAAPQLVQSWVQQGHDIHGDQTHCLFCLNEVSRERRDALAAHFDMSLKALQSDITKLQVEIRREEATVNDVLGSLPSEGAFSEGLQVRFVQLREDLFNQSAIYRASLAWALANLERKESSLFTPLTPEGTPQMVRFDANEIQTVVEAQNAQVREFRVTQASHGEEVELATVRLNRPKFDAYRAEELALTGTFSTADLAIKALEPEIRALEHTALDPQPLCDALNKDLNNYFHRQDLQFTCVNGTGYQVLRQGLPAHNLSEGERTLIALLFFLYSLAQHGLNQSEAVVVVDDPVSSLDHSALIGISSLLWQRLYKKCGQLFLMTHEFELFRIWATMLKPRGDDAPPKGSLFEIVMKRHPIEGGYERRPHLQPWPEALAKKCLSEYHYLFAKVSRVAQQDPGDATEDDWAAANACRKLLESFLAFTYPKQIGQLTNAVAIAGDACKAPELAERVIRFVHTHSHREDPDAFRHHHRPEVIENAQSVLEFMKKVDPAHVTRTLQAIAD